ncbi:hypothetical protein GCM10011418_44460 [Sphingobacterium alkalisoli]|nr:hypothetical protein [Sphingobacterium alkalisoli]GGH31562.1 hypothetical protein GCM10011418_44460 [Sphingobacterium alkalisoli]
MIKPFSDKSIYTHTMKEINTYDGELGGNKLPEALRVNPFTVPPDYFNVQESSILSLVRLDKLAIQKDNQATPEGYFEKLQNDILAKVAEQKLKDEVATTGFTIPAGYLEGAEEAILHRIAEAQLKNAVDQDGYEVPTAYFETLEQDILLNVAIEKLKTEVSETGYQVPAGYFDRLSEKTSMIPASTNTHESAMKGRYGQLETVEKEIRTLPSRKRWASYAAAAAVAALIGIGSYFSFSQQDEAIYSEDISFSEIPDEAIVSYLAQTSDGNDMIFFSEYLEIPETVEIGSQVKDKDIEEYLNYML